MRSNAQPRQGSWRSLLVFVVAALAFAMLAWTAAAVRDQNRHQLLNQRSDEVVQTLDTVLPLLQVPLSSGLAVATESRDPQKAFDRVAGTFVGDGTLMQSVSLWRLTSDGAHRIASVGQTSTLERMSPEARLRALAHAPTSGIGIVDLTQQPRRALGFALTARGSDPLVAYLEAPLPKDPTALDLTGNAFRDLNIEVHLGPGRSPSRLLFATTRQLPLPADAPTRTVPWGNSQLVLVFAPKAGFGDPLLGRLPLIILITGLTLAAGFAVLTDQLERSRRASVLDAGESQRRYIEQRNVANRLQGELLPDPLPAHPGVQLATRYEAGADGVDIGGDWYDVVPIDDDHMILSVGDVSGQGIRAAAIMVALRAAIRAYALEGDGPGDILGKLVRLLDVRTDGHFATILCACVHIHAREVVLATAGHPPPVLATDAATRFVPLETGLPIGVSAHGTYPECTISLDPGATLVSFTDGLYERRGETVDLGLERVRVAVQRHHGASLEVLVDRLTDELQTRTAPDDTAVIALRLPATGAGTAPTP